MKTARSFHLIFQLSGWAFVAPSCFTTTVFCGFRDRLALDMEGTCELAERFDLVHHIPEAAISDWYTKEPARRSFCLERKDNRAREALTKFYGIYNAFYFAHRSRRTAPSASCCRSCWYRPLYAHAQVYHDLHSYLGMPKVVRPKPDRADRFRRPCMVWSAWGLIWFTRELYYY